MVGGSRRVSTAVTMLALLAMACGTPAPPQAIADPTTSPDPSVVAPSAGRSVCPGSTPTALDGLTGAPADALEELQGTYENDRGFLAVVFDGAKAIVVVQADQWLEWQARLAVLGIAVASSCVDPGLLVSIPEALQLINKRTGRAMSSGYDALDDAMSVAGVLPDELVRTLDEIEPGSGAAALAAITAGTLRITPGFSGGQRL